ncbi:hypothetical protein C6Q28_02975 [Burkholderia multivorans]|uniref:Uncharacterized protein n=1 Tax=Burkholderia multivorans TaxID=87883 RepID=A0A228DN56_9BURK|nr:hypothetical protein CA831_36280 [Burkholderia multivorans]OXH85835.1 hypothetical protein CA830_27825 [Burkholderia multivorans]PRE05835.1 hypothetical protein C6P91_11550 [Burkholderia multivorans]PRE87192.1 hypothetical protein C6Q02_06915 [Burkholderia multivorans]PRE95359.1 hypothetical protein C6Q07_32600 [Burkholderia multivorans]
MTMLRAASADANCTPAFRVRLCLCRPTRAHYPHEKARRGPCIRTRPHRDAAPLTRCRPTNRS